MSGFPDREPAVYSGAPAHEVPEGERDGDILEADSRMLHDADPEVRRRAAFALCTWESVPPDRPTGSHRADGEGGLVDRDLDDYWGYPYT